MASCQFDGNTDMYGIGIRVGFYLTWFGSIASDWVSASEVPSLRLSYNFFVTAEFVALVFQSARANLRPVEMYIILLLTFGGSYYLVPLYLYRIATCCNPYWDPTRWPRLAPSKLYSFLVFLLIMAVSCFQMWFWCTGIYTAEAALVSPACERYGFFLSRVPLKTPGFVAINVLFSIMLLIASFYHLCLLLDVVKLPPVLAGRAMRVQRSRARYKLRLQKLGSVLRLLIATVIVVATELTIKWNGIKNVQDATTAGQTIPIVVSAGLLARLVYLTSSAGHDSEPRWAEGPLPPTHIPLAGPQSLPQALPSPVGRPPRVHNHRS